MARIVPCERLRPGPLRSTATHHRRPSRQPSAACRPIRACPAPRSPPCWRNRMDRMVARRALLAAVAVGIAAQGLVVSLAVGVNLALLTGITLVAVAALAHGSGRRIDTADAWIPVAALLVAAGTAIRSDEFLVFLDA